MLFERKLYSKLLDWKENYGGEYSLLIEGARRVGKSTLVEAFAKQEYESYILIDFSSVRKDVLECFVDIGDIDLFLLRLQAVTGVQLVKHKSAIVFDEVQLYPKARQALKHLVKDGRYHYIATGSLISIKIMPPPPCYSSLSLRKKASPKKLLFLTIIVPIGILASSAAEGLFLAAIVYNFLTAILTDFQDRLF